MKTRASLLVGLWIAAAAAVCLAVEVAGVKVPDTVTVEGKTLKLNGAGLRKKFGIAKVYVAALYVETPSKDPAALIGSPDVKSMRLSILRTLKGAQVSEAIEAGFEKNSKDQLPKLNARLSSFKRMIPDVKEGDQIELTWIPEKGTRVIVRGSDRGTIEGRDFADALFSVWLGPAPTQDDLKKALLGG